MLNDLFGGWHILIVLAIVVLLFGATRLPALARSLGQSRNAFKAEMKKGEETGIPDSTTSASTTNSTAANTDASNATNSTPTNSSSINSSSTNSPSTNSTPQS